MPQDERRAMKASLVRSKSFEKPNTPQRCGERGRKAILESPINHDILTLRKENKNLRKYLQSVVNVIKWFTNRLDAEMKLPSTHERGKRIARLTNALNYAMESAEYHGLGVNYRKAKDLTEGQRVTLDKQFQQIAEFNKKMREDIRHYENLNRTADGEVL